MEPLLLRNKIRLQQLVEHKCIPSDNSQLLLITDHFWVIYTYLCFYLLINVVFGSRLHNVD